MAAGQVFIALDYPDLGQALQCAAALAPCGVRFKVGLELFCRHGPEGVAALQRVCGPVLLDLKLHDIPHTVGRAVRGLAALGAWGVTLHAAGGPVMLRSAVTAAAEAVGTAREARLRTLAVTVLTSLDEQVLHALGVHLPLREQVGRLASLARAAGCDGAVCSPEEVGLLRELVGGDFFLLTPGVRPPGVPAGDQARVGTAAVALAAGADAVVLGRAVTQTPDPPAALAQILADLEAAP